MTEKKDLPMHIAIIMDGNGRWAKKKGQIRTLGHRAGIKSIESAVDTCLDLGIKYLTLYAFSSENWNRPRKEIDILMALLYNYLDKQVKDFGDRGIRLVAIGELGRLPGKVYDKLKEVIEETKDNSKFTLTLALSYGSRTEIINAVKGIAKQVKNKEIILGQIDEKLFSDYLYTSGMPDPDILIRTSNEFRLSNFLLWQLSYSELYFSPKLWPDFNKQDLIEIIKDYQKRERRFGRV